MAAEAATRAHGPSSRKRRAALGALAGAAFLIASYLSLVQWRVIGSVWDPAFGSGSERVLDSRVSATFRAWVGLPDAAVGALAYLVDLSLTLAGSARRWRRRPWLVVLSGAWLVPLVLSSALLVLLQGTLVRAWCLLCLVTAAISPALAVLARDEVCASLGFLRAVWRRTHDRRALWDAFRGRSSVGRRRAWGLHAERGVMVPLSRKERVMNTDTLKGDWKQLKGKAKAKWGKLSDDDLKRVEGRREQLEGVLQEKYGMAKEQAKREVDEFDRANP